MDIFSKYAWVVPLEDKKGSPITNTFQKNLDKYNPQPNKIWVDKDSKVYNKSIKSWLHDNDNVVERSIRNLKNNIYKYMTSTSKNVCIDKLEDIVHEYNNTYSTIKMMLVDVN